MLKPRQWGDPDDDKRGACCVLWMHRVDLSDCQLINAIQPRPNPNKLTSREPVADHVALARSRSKGGPRDALWVKYLLGTLFADRPQYAALPFFYWAQIGLSVALIGMPCVSLWRRRSCSNFLP
jgi:hypothetical protein